ncbi:MAG: DPP IV N-terminal domain-containing protein, partial [Longimicrobiales bacterium]
MRRTAAVSLFLSVSLPLFGTPATPLLSQTTPTDYARAERFLGWNARNLVSGDEVSPRWMEGDRFWYRSHVKDGYEFVLVDPDRGSWAPAFDHDRLAAALSEAADTSYVGHKLPFEEIELVPGGEAVRFYIGDSIRWSCDLRAYRCRGPDTVAKPPVTETASPDGRWVAFEREENLWVREMASGEETQLTTDGETDFGYAVQPEGCCSVVTNARQHREAPPVLAWSEDSRRIATHRFDERGVREMALLETNVKGPLLHTYHNALPGDSVIPTYQMHVFDLEARTGVASDRPPQEMVNTSCCGLLAYRPPRELVWKDARWGEGNQEFFFTYGHRSFDTLQLVAMDATTGTTRTVITETSPTFVEMNARSGGIPNWRVVEGNREVVWFSERDGWGHLYRYDASSGALLNRITEGPWMVVDLLEVDEAGEWVYFTAVGREEGRDPYYRHLYRVGLDGSGLQLLTPEDGDHEITFSPSGGFLVDTYSTPTSEPVTVLRRPDGARVLTLEEGDFSELLATGWSWPVPFTVKARDGVTDLYGYLYLPSELDPGATYPVIDYIYPGPQTGPIGFRQATASTRGNGQALAELGFFVFTIDALGTPLRAKAFHDAYYGNMGDNGIADHVAALRQLAARYPQMDLDRVGIFGHSGGGFSSTDAILRFPDVFKVAVSSAGNHDNRSYDYTWGEKYQGLLTEKPDGTDTFDSQANQNLAEKLEGKLLLMYGTLDDNVHPNATLLVIDELIRNNKDFDLVVFPNRNHGYANEPYVIRRTWDYFVKHLLGF